MIKACAGALQHNQILIEQVNELEKVASGQSMLRLRMDPELIMLQVDVFRQPVQGCLSQVGMLNSDFL